MKPRRLRAFISQRAIGRSRNAREARSVTDGLTDGRTYARRRPPPPPLPIRLHLGPHASRRARDWYVVASCDLHQRAEYRARIHYYCHRKAKLRWCDGRRVFQGRLPWRYAGTATGCSLEYPPSCLFSAIPSRPLPPSHRPATTILVVSPFGVLSFSRPCSLALFLRVPLATTLSGSQFAFFSPVYIRIHSTTLPVRPLVPSSPPFVLVGPFASFVPRLTPFQRRQRWLAG